MPATRVTRLLVLLRVSRGGSVVRGGSLETLLFVVADYLCKKCFEDIAVRGDFPDAEDLFYRLRVLHWVPEDAAVQQDAFGVLAILCDLTFVFVLLVFALFLLLYSGLLHFAEALFSGGLETAESRLVL